MPSPSWSLNLSWLQVTFHTGLTSSRSAEQAILQSCKGVYSGAALCSRVFIAGTCCRLHILLRSLWLVQQHSTLPKLGALAGWDDSDKSSWIYERTHSVPTSPDVGRYLWFSCSGKLACPIQVMTYCAALPNWLHLVPLWENVIGLLLMREFWGAHLKWGAPGGKVTHWQVFFHSAAANWDIQAGRAKRRAATTLIFWRSLFQCRPPWSCTTKSEIAKWGAMTKVIFKSIKHSPDSGMLHCTALTRYLIWVHLTFCWDLLVYH